MEQDGSDYDVLALINLLEHHEQHNTVVINLYNDNRAVFAQQNQYAVSLNEDLHSSYQRALAESKEEAQCQLKFPFLALAITYM